MITAYEAKRKTDANVTYLHNDKYVWDSLCKEIEKAISDGKYYCHFKETESCHFYEDRKLIKDKMEAMGYEVSYHRYHTYNDYYDLNKYYNIYEISWRIVKMIISGYIDSNYDGWATVDGKKFANYMYEYANVCSNSVAYEHHKNLGGQKAIIPDCNISMYFSKKEMNLEEAQEKFFDSFFGTGDYEMEANYVGYSEWTITGYDLEECTLCGHDLNSILLSHSGEYVNIYVD